MRKAYIDLELESEINSDIHTVKVIYILGNDESIPDTIPDSLINTENGITVIDKGKYELNVRTGKLVNPYFCNRFYNYHFLGIEEICIPQESNIRIGFGRRLAKVELVLYKNYYIPDDLEFYINDSGNIVVKVPGQFIYSNILSIRWIDTNREEIDKIISRIISSSF